MRIGLGLPLTRLPEDPGLILHVDFIGAADLIEAVRRGPAITFTRASGAAFFDSAGALKTTASGVARVGSHVFDGAKWVDRGLLIEEVRTNRALHSEGLSAPWISIGTLDIFSNSVVAPDGTTTIDRIADGQTGSSVALSQTRTLPSSANLRYTFSAYVKKATQSSFPEFRIDMTGGTQVRTAIQLDTETGATTTRLDTGGGTPSAEVEDLGDFWRIAISATNVGSNTSLAIQLFPAVTTTFGTQELNALGGVNAWGYQLEQAAFATSYIKTTSASVTRAADVDSQNIVSLVSIPLVGTLFVSARTGFGAGVVVQIDDGTENERYRIERNSSDEIHVIITDGGAEQANLNLGAVADNTAFKVAGRIAANDFAASLDGAAVVTDTSGTLPRCGTLRVGMDTANDEWNSTIARVTLWNHRQLDAFLQSVSS